MYPSCFVVPQSLMAQVGRAQQLIRPNEIQHLVVEASPCQALFGPLPPLADRVSQFFKARFAYRVLRYERDPEGMDLWCSPAATLKRGGGDCDDLGLLAASLFYAAGLPVHVIIGTINNEGHLWVEGKDEAGYFWFEATSGDVLRNLWVARNGLGYSPTVVVTPRDWALAN